MADMRRADKRSASPAERVGRNALRSLRPTPSREGSGSSSAHSLSAVPAGTGCPRRNASAAIAGRPASCTRVSRSAPLPQATVSRSSSTVAGRARPVRRCHRQHLQHRAAQRGERAGPGIERPHLPLDRRGVARPVDPPGIARQLRRIGRTRPPVAAPAPGFGQRAQDQPRAQLRQHVVQRRRGGGRR